MIGPTRKPAPTRASPNGGTKPLGAGSLGGALQRAVPPPMPGGLSFANGTYGAPPAFPLPPGARVPMPAPGAMQGGGGPPPMPPPQPQQQGQPATPLGRAMFGAPDMQPPGAQASMGAPRAQAPGQPVPLQGVRRPVMFG